MGRIHNHKPVRSCKGKESVSGVLLGRFYSQLNGGGCYFHTLAFHRKYFPRTNAYTYHD
jgi:hypothetical protein